MPNPVAQASTYCQNPYQYTRRISREVKAGEVGIGGKNPIRIQSMLTCATLDTETCIAQTLALVEAGCELVRITAQTKRHAANLEHIKKGLLEKECSVPIVADIHFKPDAALEAARWVEKVRINPGNYADSKKFTVREYTDAEYTAEIERIEKRFSPLVLLCKERGVAMRIGTNHGSLSDRIMNRYGDTPLGMVESALEFAHIARRQDYHNFVFSMKASNPKVMIAAYRLLIAKLNELGEDWNYPVHLGVTEAGDGEDGRIKSAIGIGSLLSDGIGDTIRVSLTEEAIQEIPVAQALLKPFQKRNASSIDLPSPPLSYDPFAYHKRETEEITLHGIQIGGRQTVRVVTTQQKFDQLSHKLDQLGEFQPELIYEQLPLVELDPLDSSALEAINQKEEPTLVTLKNHLPIPVISAYRLLAAQLEPKHPILLKDTLSPSTDPQKQFLETLLESSTTIGSLLCDGIGDALLIQGEEAPGQSLRLAYNILQASGTRIFKTDYVACPSCGRTLFDLQTTTAKIRQATGHLKGVRIAIMGCIVNGPGEMADADFGYVGGAPGKINLYVGKKPTQFNIPQEEAVDRLIDLIKEHGKWRAPKQA